MMFRSYSTTSEYFESDYVAIAMAILRLDIFTRQNMDFLSGRNPNKTLVFI